LSQLIKIQNTKTKKKVKVTTTRIFGFGTNPFWNGTGQAKEKKCGKN